jgi:predicted transcriptional regulator
MTEQPQTNFVSDRQMLIMGMTQAIVVAALHPGSGINVVEFIDKVHAKVSSLVDGPAPATSDEPKPTASEIRKSITPDHLISFEDGKRYKTLRRHLTLRGLTPEQYRTKHGLPADYPMTSATYSAQRSELARALGLGQQRRKTPAAPPAAPAPKARRAKALEPA